VLIAGERRLLAAKEAGLETVPVVVREATDQQRLELALIENIQRADLNPLEEAEAYRQLADDFGMTHEAIAIRVSKKRTTVTNTLRLLNLTADAKQALVDGEISEGHARALLSLESKQAQSAALSTLLRNDLNVRQTEELVRKLSGNKVTRRSRPALSPEIADLEERLRSHLNTQVSMKEYRKGGSITIRYFSDEELNAILDRFFADQS
jgi:ParB family chromosome partitioning protein